MGLHYWRNFTPNMNLAPGWLFFFSFLLEGDGCSECSLTSLKLRWCGEDSERTGRPQCPHWTQWALSALVQIEELLYHKSIHSFPTDWGWRGSAYAYMDLNFIKNFFTFKFHVVWLWWVFFFFFKVCFIKGYLRFEWFFFLPSKAIRMQKGE